MHATPSSTRSPRLLIHRVVAIVVVLATAALLAAGCAGDETTKAGLGGPAGGPMAWLPADTWMVASGNTSAAAIDGGLASLDRLAIWSLVEGELPAQNGVDLRLELLKQVAAAVPGTNAKDLPSSDELEAAFGDRMGLAIFDRDLSKLDSKLWTDDAPVAAWIHVDDEQLALEATEQLLPGTERTAKHRGVRYYESADEHLTFAVRDELLIATTSPARMKQLIDMRRSARSNTLAGDATATRVAEAGIGDAIVGVAIQTDPLLEIAAQRAGDSTGDTPVAAALSTTSVDNLIPDWVAASFTVDETGMRMRGAWSNPREIADPAVGSRELVERMPATATQVSASVSDGSALARVQGAWSEIQRETDIDVDQVFTGCTARDAWACTIAADTLTTLLEDESLAAALDAADDSVMVMSQSLMPQTLEVVTDMSGDVGWQLPAKLRSDLRAAGITLTPNAKGGIVAKVAPKSQAGAALRRALGSESGQATALLGVDPRALLTPKGLSLTPTQVADLSVFSLPATKRSPAAQALAGDIDTLADDRSYADVVTAASPPKQVGSYGWLNLSAMVEGVLTSLAADEPNVQRALPSVRNNLTDMPGVVWWSTRTEVDGEQVGVAQAVVPILE